MARVRFMFDFDYRPAPRTVIAYRGGHAYTVKRECADQAVAAGKGIEVGAPSREERQKPIMRAPRSRKAKVQNAKRG